jgi:peptide chain release factor 2
MSAQDFWNDQETAQKLMVELKSAKSIVDAFRKPEQELSDEIELLDMAEEDGDEQHMIEVKKNLKRYRKQVAEVELQALFSMKNDPKAIFLSIHAGEGGTDSCDWAEMLLRMYTRWLEKNGYDVKLVDAQYSEEAGIRRGVLQVSGRYPYGHLKSELGVHRLVRISPFDANNRRHTSFASVDVVPLDDDIEVDIKDADLKIDTYCAGGPGGQHVNKTESAVRITHIPTGVVVSCQNERSQMLNRKTAMKMLASKLHRLEEAKREKELARLYGEKGEIGRGNQIRSYFLHPYQLVKDHRTNFEMGNAQAVLDGEIDGYIEAFLKWKDRKY